MPTVMVGGGGRPLGGLSKERRFCCFSFKPLPVAKAWRALTLKGRVDVSLQDAPSLTLKVSK